MDNQSQEQFDNVQEAPASGHPQEGEDMVVSEVPEVPAETPTEEPAGEVIEEVLTVNEPEPDVEKDRTHLNCEPCKGEGLLNDAICSSCAGTGHTDFPVNKDTITIRNGGEAVLNDDGTVTFN